MSHHAPIQLLVEEPLPGSFTWTLRETDAEGRALRILRRGDDGFDNYEQALAAGSRALSVLMHQTAPAH